MRVAVHYHGSRQGAEETAEAVAQAGGEAALFQADLYDRDAARRLIDEAVDHFGTLDLLVPSAANFDRVAFEDTDDAFWDRALRLNLEAPATLAHRAREPLRAARGSVVLITCTSATRPFRDHLPYVVSKGAASQLMRTLALELAPHVRVNAVAPGTVLPPPGMAEGTLERIRERIPLARLGDPEDVAEAVVFLARAPFVTGQELAVDGGHTVGVDGPAEGSAAG
jgi:pteridine reductase